MSVGDNIKQRRAALGITAEELGRKIGKSRATIYRYENGEIENMPTPVLEPIANALGITPAELMNWQAGKQERDTNNSNVIKADQHELQNNLDNNNRFSESEMHMISQYRDLDLHGKDMVDTVLNKEHERCIATKSGEVPSWVPEPEKFVFDREKFEQTIFGNNTGMAARNGKNPK